MEKREKRTRTQCTQCEASDRDFDFDDFANEFGYKKEFPFNDLAFAKFRFRKMGSLGQLKFGHERYLLVKAVKPLTKSVLGGHKSA